MAFGSVTLVPGVNTERTPTLLRAGISQSNLIRFKDSLAQKIGGWQRFYPFQVSGTPRDLHAWQDLNENSHLSIGTTTQLAVISAGVFNDITPQTFATSNNPTVATTVNSNIVVINDPSIANPTVYNSVFFNTPISIGGLILDGLYPITQVDSSTQYEITVDQNATASSTSQAFATFTTTAGSSIVNVNFVNHGITQLPAEVVFTFIDHLEPGLTIGGSYSVLDIVDANNFTIQASSQATATGTSPQNGGNLNLIYYITLGPTAPTSGYGIGPYGSGAYGFGTSGGGTPQTGAKITAADWTSDNWGEIGIFCPANQAIYYWDPTGGFTNASVISSAPPFNSGIFVSTTEQILLAYGSSVHQAIGWQQQPLLVQWSDVSNFFQWNATAATQAGNFVIPIGSAIMAGAAVSNQNLFWTDLDLWAATYIGPPNVFGFNKIGAGMGAVSRHAVQTLRGSVYWMSQTNFCSYTSNGANVLPCTVWDAVFQNINTAFLQNVRAMPNTPYNEAGWLYPSAASTSGECDSYVKMNITDPGAPWDYGPMQRSAWIDQTVLGMPIGASPQGFIYQHETSPDADGAPLVSGFTTGFYYLEEGENFVIVDQVLPDFRWSTFNGGASAQIQMTFNVVDYPGDTPRVYGPYTVTSATDYISTRFRGRLMSITIESSDLGSWWRIGSCKYRYAAAGRR